MNKILEVKDLKISFRTAAGKVQAVRDISFDLNKGETLAIVGESGSGKSVTAKAIMGISALNAVIENGEIFYGGDDLVKYGEEDFQKIRGNKIAMIFQDPLSSLNPIVKVGRQMTEAMLFKNKADRKNGKRDFYKTIGYLSKAVFSDCQSCELKDVTDKFVAIEKIATKAESEYLQARKTAEEVKARVDDLLVAFDKKDEKTVLSRCAGIYKYAVKCKNRFLPVLCEDSFTDSVKRLKSETNKKATLDFLSDALDRGLSLPVPEFFAIAYYENESKASDASAPVTDLAGLNEKALACCKEFEASFYAEVKKGVECSAATSRERKAKVLPELKAALDALGGEWRKKETARLAKRLSAAVNGCIDPLSVAKDNAETTFSSCFTTYCAKYFTAAAKNTAETKRFDKSVKKREELIKKGKIPEWEIVPPALTDLDDIKQNAVGAVKNVIAVYERTLSSADENPDGNAEALIKFLKGKASATAYRVTKTSAKRRAIRLLNEVGIPDPEKRFEQYPFQLSGGQRQRVVIAIALSADPEVLICDEPTTALDVTIQAQILELINKVKRERELSVIFITHDLGVVANIADRIAVMYAGKIVEYGLCEEVFYSPAHPYTWALLSSVPDLESKGRLEAIPGTPPNMIYPPVGDAFAERNRYALQIDFKRQPPMFKITDTHYAATWLLHPSAPKTEMPKAISDRIARMKKEANRGR